MARDRSIEEQVEDWCKRQFKRTSDYFTKTESINPEIEEALRKAPSKKGGVGSNFPDIKCFVETDELRRIPVMIEVKGTKGDLAKLNDDGSVCNKNTKGEPHYTNIAKYAVNGAVHYAHAILDYADSYNEVIAVGVNGYREKGHDENTYEVSVWYVSKENLFVPKKVADYTDLSFLLPSNVKAFLQKVDALQLTDEEIEQQKTLLEDDIERKLKALNQKMHDEQGIAVGDRVQLVAGMIMAGLGVKGVVEPLRIEDLRGQRGEYSNDGVVFMNKISDYLQKKHLPSEKIQMITEILNKVFLHSKLEEPIDGESRLKTLYRDVKHDIMPFVNGEMHNLDFTGRLFNVMNDWVDVPDGDLNDVVLTPRCVTELMARLCRVNKDSYVWDFATGSAGFLISAMHLMIADAKEKISSPAECERKISQIKMEQLLGIEKLPDIYMLAVLNMILMKDGCSNIIHGDSFKFEGNYEQGKKKGSPFPANVFLLNPPYSADGKGLCFVERALGMMTHGGRAAVLIQENAGAGKGLPFTKEILRNNTLLASIKMSTDLFIGKASVQTAIYVFEVNIPHDKNSIVKFIDFSNDGYSRQNRKKASLSVNLRDTDHAKERYEEVVNLVLYGNKYLHYLEGCYEEDTISLNGRDWTYGQHRKIDTHPTDADFRKVVQDYLAWNISEIIRNNREAGLEQKQKLRLIEKQFLTNGGYYKRCRARELFSVKSNPQLDKGYFTFSDVSEYPYFTRTVSNNGILGNVDYYDDEHLIKGNSIAVGMMGMQFFYMPHDFYAGQFTKTIFPLFEGFNEWVALWFISRLNKSREIFLSLLVRDFEDEFNEIEIEVPRTEDGRVAVDYMESYMRLYKDEQVIKINEYINSIG